MDRFDQWIDGAWRKSNSEEVLEVVNPANGAVIAVTASGSNADVDEAVRVAKSAFDDGRWSGISPSARAAKLRALAAAIRAHADELARAETLNVGKPFSSAQGEIGYAAQVYDFYANAIAVSGGQTFSLSAPGLGLTLREPIGVCGLIVPWNFPFVIAAWKLAPCLAMGNTAVLKPAEWTPLSGLRLGELAKEAGIPDGVVNVVTGLGHTAGAALASHKDVRKVAFTGSTKTGRAILHAAADDIKRVSLELGGKSPCLVFADSDLEKASGSVMSVFDNTGQDCCARSRYLIERSVYDEFVDRFVENSRAIRVGDPWDSTTQLGPLVTRAHWDRVHSYVRAAASSAQLCCGGGAPAGFPEDGCYYSPTVFKDADPASQIMQEEVFGPVVCLTPFDSEAEAIAIANATPFGLSGSVWTRDIQRAMRVTRAVKSGVISVNSSSSVHLEMPFGGLKQSGVGKDLGLSALDNYSDIKTVFIQE